MGLPPEGQRRLVSFDPIEENWSYYGLEDGYVLGVKVVVTKVFRLTNPDGTDMRDPEGNPLYFFLSQNVVRVFTPQQWKEVRAKEVRK